MGLRIFGPDVIARLDGLDGLKAVLRMDLGSCSESCRTLGNRLRLLLDDLGIFLRFANLSPALHLLLGNHRWLRLGLGLLRHLRCLVCRPGFLGILDCLVGLVSRLRHLEYLERVHYTQRGSACDGSVFLPAFVAFFLGVFIAVIGSHGCADYAPDPTLAALTPHSFAVLLSVLPSESPTALRAKRQCPLGSV